MVVDPFVAGVFVTIAVECIAIVIAGIFNIRRK